MGEDEEEGWILALKPTPLMLHLICCRICSAAARLTPPPIPSVPLSPPCPYPLRVYVGMGRWWQLRTGDKTRLLSTISQNFTTIDNFLEEQQTQCAHATKAFEQIVDKLQVGSPRGWVALPANAREERESPSPLVPPCNLRL